MATIAPWINVRPADYLAAGERGLALGEAALANRQRVGAELAAISQRAAAESERLKQAQVESQMELAARNQQAEREFLLREQQNRILNAYHNADIGLRQDEAKRAAQAAAAKLSAQTGLAREVRGGKPFGQAILDFPELVGSGAVSELMRPSTPATEHISDVDRFKLQQLSKQISSRQSMMQPTDDLQQQVDAILGKYGGGGTAAASPAVKFEYDQFGGKFNPVGGTNSEPAMPF